MFLMSCASEKKPQDKKVEVEELTFAENPEEIKGRVDVYTTMARATKYNVNVATANLHKKIDNIDTKLLPRDIIQNFLNVKTEQGSKIYDALRVLDFSIIYAMANLNLDKAYVDNFVYAKSAQNLALAAIKTHKDALYAKKEVKDVVRLIGKEQKQLSELNAKFERTGTLNDQEIDYKKALEISIMKLMELKQNLDNSLNEYAFLIKTDTKNITFEGKRFYELEDFNPKTPLQNFQMAAVKNRSEFKLAKDLAYTYSYDAIVKNSLSKYKDVERLGINGYDIKNPLYIENLEQKAYKIAINLVDATFAYKNTTDEDTKKVIRQKAFDELGIAILAQVELSYNTILLADWDFNEVQKNEKDLENKIKNAEKSYRLKPAEKVDLLADKLKLMGYGVQKSQILAERAMAIRSLYFFSGFSPFNKKLLQSEIKDIVLNLKTGFNKDVITILAESAPSAEDVQFNDEKNWARQENWLENLIEGTGASTKKSEAVDVKVENTPAKVIGNFDMYEEESYDMKTVAQLGSYHEKANADLDWKMLKVLYPDLDAYSPIIERVHVNGEIMYRLILKSNQGGFRSLCNKLRSDKVECLLR